MAEFKMSKVSIVIPLYNRENLVLDTIRSIKNQKHQNFECLVIDDHSTDNSYAVVEEFCLADNRFKIWRRRGQIRGACACRNEGIENASGEFLMFLDSDDVLRPECFGNRLEKILSANASAFIVTQIAVFHHENYKATQLWSSLKHKN